jgi:shikimate dehydrogenase
MVRPITKDTVLCMSLSGRPSNVGTRFHNFLYAELDLDFVYKAFTTTDLAAAIAGIRALGIRGCGVSMPCKEACVELVDELDGSAEAIGSVNTIVNTGGRLRAYNTDYLAVAELLVNATPVGMAGGPAADDLPVAPEVVDAAESVLDVVAVPALTPLVRRARAQDKQVITGAEVITLQAVEQFVLYTGVRPDDDQVRRASELSRA